VTTSWSSTICPTSGCSRRWLPVPVLLDQPFWAERLHRLGVAPPPLPLQELIADNLAEGLRNCLDPRMRDRAADLACRVGAEDGPAAALALVTQLAGAAG